MSNDMIARLISAEHIRDWTVICNVVSALFVGPYLAFAATPEAGFKCLQAFVRMIHRIFLVGFSIALMNNAYVIITTPDRVPTGSALALNVLIFATVVCSAVRYHWWMADISKGASWRHPHFVQRSEG